ncbi:antitoxin Xre/MbcA/ParS toxin-binding domain-containing protein [Edaphobacter aggregans]|uniref:antitoxin Xre/MbcA/ParS toxin-binding domain-containing protein n=1 Tax=Edaphobacter aggregans TaxID=570835 RepID=UPI0014706BE2|nr:antitoxin Xre/MbcA/ParS toxin-binding domain-containing protein [Edaphobacter aggregans]
MNIVAKELPSQQPVLESDSTAENRILDSIFGKRPTEFQLAVMVEQGLPISSVEVLRNEGLTFSEVHRVVLPARTLKHRKDKQQSLSLEEADRTLRVAKIITLADHVFGNHDKALRWLRRGNQRLEGRSPLEMLRSEVGGDLVRQMLYQIDEGMFV